MTADTTSSSKWAIKRLGPTPEGSTAQVVELAAVAITMGTEILEPREEVEEDMVTICLQAKGTQVVAAGVSVTLIMVQLPPQGWILPIRQVNNPCNDPTATPP